MKILLYNMNTARGKQIEQVCLPLRILCVTVPASDTLQPVGAVAQLPGFQRRMVPPFAPPLAEEMMVFSGGTQREVFALLDALRRAGVTPPRLKAMLTPSNAAWDALALQRELTEEAERMG
jgi:hypothetical protein